MDVNGRIVIATDAWHPQVNGVVRTLATTITHLRADGHAVEVVEPGMFPHLPCPVYPEIALSLPDPWRLAGRVAAFRPDRVHIATEGPVGLAVRALCRRRRWAFTTSYHTRFPEYLNAMLRVPAGLTYRYMRWFHAPAAAMFVATDSMERELRDRRFTTRVARWSRGVDLGLFHPRPRRGRPVMLFVGRVSREKNLEAFLSLNVPGTKVVVGDGPQRAALAAAYPAATFVGPLTGEPLAAAFADADVFVFPSRTDTFGLVLLEAMASGVPVAAYPVPGPVDIVRDGVTGCLHDDLATAVRGALALDAAAASVEHAQQYQWDACSRQFFDHLALTGDRQRAAVS